VSDRRTRLMPEIHKEGQGVVVRRMAFWLLVALIVWGGQSLYTWLISTFEISKKLLFEDGGHHDGFEIPVLDQRFDVGFLIAWGVVGLGTWLVFWFLNRAKSADFLIETNEELRKVTWPSWPDAKNSSVIVLVFVVFLACLLWGSDYLLGLAFNALFSVFAQT